MSRRRRPDIASAPTRSHEAVDGARTLRAVIAVAGGLGAALCWALATIVSSRSSKLIGPSAVLGWVMLVGAVAAFVPALIARPADDVGDLGGLAGAAAILSVVAGAAYVGGLYLNYRALRIGPVGIAAPIASTEGALAAVIAVFLGEPLGVAAAAMLGLIVVGVVLASMAPSGGGPALVEALLAEPTLAEPALAEPVLSDPVTMPPQTPHGSTRTTAGFAIAAASLFAIGLVASARAVGMGMPVAWVALVARLIGIAAVTVPVALRGRLTMVRPAVALVVVAGLGEVIGTAVYTIGAQGGIAIAAVIASQFATISAVAAYFLFGERLTRFQVVGIGLVVIGVTAVSALSVG
jgi:drug/metabolite transporter (DMT)-like permease